MKHLGDITKIDGAAVDPVEVIIGGSPCQDLSVAGKREGLSGERSGLFMEQIRIIKEMREHDRQNGATYIRPRYMVWENVPGAFSSNKGEDFRIVLEETARVVEPTAVIPRSEGGKWTNAGAIVGDGWSIAWRVFDAQFWGVPQRRRRIALVADFGGATAPEILFERKGVFGDITQSATPWKDFASAIAKRFGSTNQAERGSDHLTHCIKCQGVEVAPTVTAKYGTGGGNTPLVYDARGNGEGRTAPTITGDHENRVTDYTALAVGFPLGFRPENVRTYNETATTLCNGTRPGNCNGVIVRSIGNGQANSLKPSEKAETLNCMHDQQAVITIDRAAFNQGKNAKFDFSIEEEKIGAQVARGPGAVCTKGDNDAETRNQILRLLQETYGEETVFKWGAAILERLQQTDILQQGVYESSIQGKTENWQELDGGSLPRPSVVAEWLLRDMRQREECGCPPQGRESSEQRFKQFDEVVPELSQQNSQTCKDLFDMWKKGQGIRLLQQALHQIQKIWESVDVPRSVVRRLTPLEAERLQGYPDGWTDIGDYTDTNGKKRKTSDSARYKALGNSIALPSWAWLLERLNRYCRYHTMASLFDGIGGFPLIWETLNGSGSCIWASEIEEFPIAVTKYHFGENI